MMLLSTLLIDAGDNPDRPRPGRLWLRNLYHVHQRLSMAFPSAKRKADDPDFLKPFKPEDFGNKQVHVNRAPDCGFLFRIDPKPNGRVVILVQSAAKPDWDYAFHNARYLLAAPPEVKPFDLDFTKGQKLRFRLTANPTKRLSRRSLKADGRPIERRWIGKRVPVPSAEEIKVWLRKNPNKDPRPFTRTKLLDWLDRWRPDKDKESGFSIDKKFTAVQPGYIYCKKPGNHSGDEQNDKQKDSGRRRSVRYDGILEVTDADLLRNTLIRGIGPGKAFGFGLLSVAPVGTLNSEVAG